MSPRPQQATSRTPIRLRQAFVSRDVVSVQCGQCPARVATLWVADSQDGRLYDGPIFAKRGDDGRFRCQRCRAPWPTDDEVTDLVEWAQMSKISMVVLGQRIPPPARSRVW